VNVHARVVVVQLGGGEANRRSSRPLALIDPVIREEGDPRLDFDGCLSFPGLYGESRRPHWLRVAGLNEKDEPFERTFEGFDAVVVHHELDHLDGILFIDRVEKREHLGACPFRC
jgi:peptide deformylase